ncbi:WYL domain-containing protein [Streptosporangium sp. NPDC005286]|uniref:WYL domain-containing protein n=1 Tax=Streptosporangium sp. NPDC005286 TaxID=3154463 RepID=UPI0033B94465
MKRISGDALGASRSSRPPPSTVNSSRRPRSAEPAEEAADVVADRISPAVGTVERIGERTCVLHTGADTVETLGVYLGLLGEDFRVTGPPELLAHLRRLAGRYARATA